MKIDKELNKNLRKIKRIIKKKFPNKKGWTFNIILWEDNDYLIKAVNGDEMDNVSFVSYHKSKNKFEVSNGKITYDVSSWEEYLSRIKELLRDLNIGNTPISKANLKKLKDVLKDKNKFIKAYRNQRGLYLDKDLIKSVKSLYENKRKIIKNNPKFNKKEKEKLIRKINKSEKKNLKKIKELLNKRWA